MATLYRTITGQSSRSRKSQDLSNSSRPAATRTTTTTTDPMTGSLNHLNSSQLEKLEQFKARLEKEGWWSPNGVNGKPTHDDGTLLRYLRARKFDITGAVGQFSDTEKWMKEQKVEELYEHFDVDFYEKARSMYPQWTGRRDRRGIPIYVFEIKALDSKNVNRYQKESQAYKDKLPQHKNLSTPAKLLPLFALYHNLLNMVLPMCSSLERPNPEIPVTNSTNIVDISGVGLTQFWNLKQHMQDASVLATAHYPETLDRIFIIGAPAFFPTVWGWIKRWFDPVTVSKIFILSKNEIKPTLESFMDLKNVPKKYGGQLDWGWGDLPSPGEEERKALESDGSKGWVRGPCLWLEQERVAVGSENGKLRRSDKEIAEKKPVLYAADYTEEPVHPERKASLISSKSDKATNGSPTATTKSAAVAPGTSAGAATVTAAAATTAATTTEPAPTTPTKAKDKNLNVYNSPSGDSQVHLPDDQPAPPAVTAEYISPNPQPVAKSDDIPATEPLAPAVVATPASSEPKATLVQPPVGQTQPGPLPEYTVQMNKKIAQNMAGESISTIPAEGNGSLAHPEMIVASDASKGLAMEADKLALTEQTAGQNGAAKPPLERFETAAEF